MLSTLITFIVHSQVWTFEVHLTLVSTGSYVFVYCTRGGKLTLFPLEPGFQVKTPQKAIILVWRTCSSSYMFFSLLFFLRHPISLSLVGREPQTIYVTQTMGHKIIQALNWLTRKSRLQVESVGLTEPHQMDPSDVTESPRSGHRHIQPRSSSSSRFFHACLCFLLPVFNLNALMEQGGHHPHISFLRQHHCAV